MRWSSGERLGEDQIGEAAAFLDRVLCLATGAVLGNVCRSRPGLVLDRDRDQTTRVVDVVDMTVDANLIEGFKDGGGIGFFLGVMLTVAVIYFSGKRP
jgi:hypothetical protein